MLAGRTALTMPEHSQRRGKQEWKAAHTHIAPAVMPFPPSYPSVSAPDTTCVLAALSPNRANQFRHQSPSTERVGISTRTWQPRIARATIVQKVVKKDSSERSIQPPFCSSSVVLAEEVIVNCVARFLRLHFGCSCIHYISPCNHI